MGRNSGTAYSSRGLASIFEIDEDKVRVIAPDVGGGFGQKVVPHPDEC